MAGRLTYIVRGIHAHKPRFVFIVLFVALGMVLLQLTTALGNALSPASRGNTDGRLLVLNGISPQLSLPRFYADRIASLDGVAAVTHATWVGAYFRHPGWMVPAIAVDPTTFFEVNPSLRTDADRLAAWKAMRNGVLVDTRFAQAYKLAVGDRLPLQSSIWQLGQDGTLDLQIMGLVNDSEPDNRPAVYFHYDYFEASRINGKSLVSYFLVAPRAGVDTTALSQRIDAQFSEQVFQGTTETAPVRLHMKLFASKMFDFGRAIAWVNAGVCGLLALLLASNLYVVAQKSMADYTIFTYLGFTHAWVLGTVFAQLACYVVCGAIAGWLFGWAALRLLSMLAPATLTGLALSAADHGRALLLIGVLVVLSTLPAMSRTAFPPVSR